MMTSTGYFCHGCGNPMGQPTESHCCSTMCEQHVAEIEAQDAQAEKQFLRPINPDPVKALAKALKARK